MENEDLNVLDGTQENVVDSQTQEEVTSEVTESTNSEMETVETVEEPAKPQQTAEENARFAEMRREYEARLRATEQSSNQIMSVLRDHYGYEGETPEDFADMLLSQVQGTSVEETRAERERENQLVQKDQEIERLKSIVYQKIDSDILATIKTIDPELKIKHIDELGDDFKRLLNMSEGDTALAYDTYKTKKARETKPVPPEIGGVNNSSSKEKDFYSSTEVDRLSKKDLNNPKIMQRVMDSMSKW